MRNVAPSRALVRRSYRLLEIAFVAVTAGIFLTMMGLALIAIPLIGKVMARFDLHRCFSARRDGIHVRW
jgi:hypothetical protein